MDLHNLQHFAGIIQFATCLACFFVSARSRSCVTDPEQPPSAHWEYLSFSVLVSSSFRRGSFLTATGAQMKDGPVGACAGIYCILPLSPFSSDLVFVFDSSSCPFWSIISRLVEHTPCSGFQVCCFTIFHHFETMIQDLTCQLTSTAEKSLTKRITHNRSAYKKPLHSETNSTSVFILLSCCRTCQFQGPQTFSLNPGQGRCRGQLPANGSFITPS